MKKRSNLFRVILILVVVLLGFFMLKRRVDKSMEPMDKDDFSTLSIEIDEGLSVGQIAEILEDEDIIASEKVFTYMAKKEGIDGDFKAGNFELSKSMDLYEIFYALTSPGAGQSDIRVAIPEGYELEEIAARFSDQAGLSKDKFLDLAEDKENFEDDFKFLSYLEDGQSLEGYLYPATYEVTSSATEASIIADMLRAFSDFALEEIEGAMEDHELDFDDLVTLASIVEREARVAEERAIMAGVFYNRMEVGMPLQSCATVQYIIGERKPVLSVEETKIDSPFNTYMNNGLPPRPIASPGIASIEAVLYPEDVDYLYFVLTGEDGSHTFSVTYDEHLKAQENMIR